MRSSKMHGDQTTAEGNREQTCTSDGYPYKHSSCSWFPQQSESNLLDQEIERFLSELNKII